MKVGRNAPCPCGSGKKYKHCCYAKDSVKHEMPETEDAVEEDTTSDDDAADDATDEKDTKAAKTPHSQQKGRARFQGEARGRSVSFRSRSPRGSQRGK